MGDYTDYEILILKGIVHGENKWSWYNLGIYLGINYDGITTNLITKLRDLEQKGLTRRSQDGV